MNRRDLISTAGVASAAMLAGAMAARAEDEHAHHAGADHAHHHPAKYKSLTEAAADAERMATDAMVPTAARFLALPRTQLLVDRAADSPVPV